MTGIVKPIGPNEPGPAPMSARISSSRAKRSGSATSTNFSALISFKL